MTETGPPLALDKDCFPTLVNSRVSSFGCCIQGRKITHETYVFLERFGKPGGGKGILISDGFCPTLTGSMLYVMTEVEDEEDMHTDRHEECN